MQKMRWLTGIVLVAALLGWLLAGNFWLWTVGAAILLAALWAWYLHDPPGSARSQGLAAALSAGALLFGVYWYMIERPGAAKLDLVLDGQGFRAGNNQALVFLTVEVRNVGNTPVRFEGEAKREVVESAPQGPPTEVEAPPPPGEVDCLPERSGAPVASSARSMMMIRVGKVVPVTPGLAARLACANQVKASDAEVRLARADQWPPVARIDQNLITRIEAGESERYFYRLLVRCERSLTLAVTARIPKRGTITDALVQQEPVGYVWIGQKVIDLSSVCGK